MASAAPVPAMPAMSAGQFCAMRLNPGDDLKESLLDLCRQRNMAAASVVTCVGSLQKASIRLADANRERSDQELHFDEKLEITSLVGTLGSEGGHLHISVANKEGRVFGGHVLPGCQIFTTAEIVVLHLPELRFSRRMDDATGFRELHVEPNRG